MFSLLLNVAGLSVKDIVADSLRSYLCLVKIKIALPYEPAGLILHCCLLLFLCEFILYFLFVCIFSLS